jgi:hypothetical protein
VLLLHEAAFAVGVLCLHALCTALRFVDSSQYAAELICLILTLTCSTVILGTAPAPCALTLGAFSDIAVPVVEWTRSQSAREEHGVD